MRADVLSAYAASASRVLGWMIVSAIVFRAGPFHFAVLALVRGAVGLLNYTTFGLTPALIRALAAAERTPYLSSGDAMRALEADRTPSNAIPYATADTGRPDPQSPLCRTYRAGVLAAAFAACIGLLVTVAYSFGFGVLHVVPVQVGTAGLLVLGMGAGTVLRLMSEAPSALIQTRRSIARDNQFSVAADVVWVLVVVVMISAGGGGGGGGSWSGDRALVAAAVGYVVSGLALLCARFIQAHLILPLPMKFSSPWPAAEVWSLLAAGSVIAAAQLADFLYAPTDYILINRFVSPGAVAIYAPAVQIDSGLLLVVGAIAAVLLPKAAMAHVAGDTGQLRRYYVRGTLSGVVMLVIASVAVYLASPWIFRLWLGDPLPMTQAILPLVLAHTILGGSSGVGRSILLAMGKAKPFAIAMLVAGVANVICSYVFVAHMGLGLRGVIYGTIAVAVGRCVIWQPWYVLRTLRREVASGGTREIKPEATAIAPEPL
jgi:O-antigen/teichoic acid export membrane protein